MKKLFFYALLAMLMASCATHRHMQQGSVTTKDSTSVSQRDSAVVVKKDSVLVSVTETEQATEVITEHIVETIDTLGIRTTVTDRTTQRRHKREQKADSMAVESSAASAVSNIAEVQNHVLQKDSTLDERKSESAVDSVSRDIRMLIMEIVLLLFVLALVWMALKWYRGS